MDTNQWAEEIADYLTREMSADERAAFERHLAKDADVALLSLLARAFWSVKVEQSQMKIAPSDAFAARRDIHCGIDVP